jgi:hypothetical protein
MKLDDRDKGRLLFVAVITLLALPAIWLVNRDHHERRPNVAAVGIEPGSRDPSVTEAVPFDPMGPTGDGYLERVPAATSADTVVIAHGTTDGRAVGQAVATYTTSSSMRSSLCRYNGMAGGLAVTVVNVANGRSIACTTIPWPGADPDTLMMAESKFQQIADLTAAPIHVEIRRSS